MNCPRCLKPKSVDATTASSWCRSCNADRSRQTKACLVILASSGLCRKESAVLLRISPKTVEKHWDNIMNRTGIHNQTQVCATLASLPQAQWDL